MPVFDGLWALAPFVSTCHTWARRCVCALGDSCALGPRLCPPYRTRVMSWSALFASASDRKRAPTRAVARLFDALTDPLRRERTAAACIIGFVARSYLGIRG